MAYSQQPLTLSEAFNTLQLNASTADLAQCKNAYKRLATMYHPDNTSNDPASTVKFQRVSLAWSVVRPYLEQKATAATATSAGKQATAPPPPDVSTADDVVPVRLDMNDVLRHPERYDLSELYYCMGPQRFFTFIRYVYAQSRQQGVRCPDCDRIHEPEYDDLAAAFYNELDNAFDPEGLGDGTDEDDEEDDDEDEDYGDSGVQPAPKVDDLAALDSWIHAKPINHCDAFHVGSSQPPSSTAASAPNSKAAESAKQPCEDLETKFFKYLFDQTLADDPTTFRGFWNKFYPAPYAYDQETDEQRKERIRQELNFKRSTEEKRRAEKANMRDAKSRQQEQKKQAADARRKAKKKQKESAQTAAQQDAQRRQDAIKREAQVIRSETFRQAKAGNSQFVRDAVYKHGVAAEGFEWILEGKPAGGNGSTSGTATPTAGSSPGSAVNMQSTASKLAKGSNSNQETLLHLAVRSGDLSLVEYLVGNGATPDELSTSGLTPIHVACISNAASIVNYFAENYPEHLTLRTTKSISTTKTDSHPMPLHMAVERYHLFCVRPLVQHCQLPVPQSLLDYVKKQLADEEKRRNVQKQLMKRLPLVWMVMRRVLDGNQSLTDQDLKEAEEAYALQQELLSAPPTANANNQPLTSPSGGSPSPLPNLPSTNSAEFVQHSSKKKSKGKRKNKEPQQQQVEADLAGDDKAPGQEPPASISYSPSNDYLLQQRLLIEEYEQHKVLFPAPEVNSAENQLPATDQPIFSAATPLPSTKKSRKQRKKAAKDTTLNPLPHVPPRQKTPEPPVIVESLEAMHINQPENNTLVDPNDEIIRPTVSLWSGLERPPPIVTLADQASADFSSSSPERSENYTHASAPVLGASPIKNVWSPLSVGDSSTGAVFAQQQPVSAPTDGYLLRGRLTSDTLAVQQMNWHTSTQRSPERLPTTVHDYGSRMQQLGGFVNSSDSPVPQQRGYISNLLTRANVGNLFSGSEPLEYSGVRQPIAPPGLSRPVAVPPPTGSAALRDSMADDLRQHQHQQIPPQNLWQIPKSSTTWHDDTMRHSPTKADQHRMLGLGARYEGDRSGSPYKSGGGGRF